MNLSEIAYKEWAECNEEEKRIQLAILEKCYGIRFGKPDFHHFVSWCKILSTPTLGNIGGLIPFEVLPHSRALIDILLTKRLISVMKSRQVWVSYTLANYILWCTGAKRGSVWLEYSRGEKESFELLAKSTRLYQYLPSILQFKRDPKGAEEMGFPSRESSIKAMSSTEAGGIGFTASGILCDEHLQHPLAQKSYVHAKPAIDTSGGQFISIFTPDKTKLDGLAFSLWKGGETYSFNTKSQKLERVQGQGWGSGENGFTSLFLPYDVIPGRDEAWYEDVKRNLTVVELEGLTPELFMESNYPRSIEEALRVPQTIQAFDVRVLDEMMSEVKNPIGSVGELDPLIVHIYQDFHLGEFYIAGTDTSHGIGKDYSVTTVMNVKTGAIVADIMSNRIPPEELALHSVALLKRYHNPLWFIESNDLGGLTIATAERLNYKHLGYQDEKRTKVGFNTGGYATPSGIKGTRTDLFGGLIPAINNHQLQIFNPEGIKQFYTIIRNAEKEGRIEAQSGGHDDYPMSVGICWAKKDEVKFDTSPSEPIATLTFEDEEPDIIKKWIKES